MMPVRAVSIRRGTLSKENKHKDKIGLGLAPGKAGFDDPVVATVYGTMSKVQPSTFMASEEGIAKGDFNEDHHAKRCELMVRRMRMGSHLPNKQKQTPRAGVLQEQLRNVDERHKADLDIIDDVQEFMKARAKLELEHAKKLQELAHQHHSGRKWAPFSYAKGHENILLADLWRSVLNLAMEDAKNHAVASERLSFLSGDVFDQHKDTKKDVFQTVQSMMENLQDELHLLDAAVAETKAQYDAAFKALCKEKKKKSKKSGEDSSTIKKLSSKAQFMRQEYLLELSAANKSYQKYKNEQLPIVLDAAIQQNVSFCSNYFKAYASLFSAGWSKSVRNMAKIDKLGSRLAAQLERRNFIHENRAHFPTQMYPIEPHPEDEDSLEIKLDDRTRNTLFQMRELLKHSCASIDKAQTARHQQMTSLQTLWQNFKEAGEMFDKQQPQLVESKMAQLLVEIEADALKQSHLKAKIDRITEAGIDGTSSSPAPRQSIPVVDISEAQAREARRLTETSEAKTKGKKGKALKATATETVVDGVVVQRRMKRRSISAGAGAFHGANPDEHERKSRLSYASVTDPGPHDIYEVPEVMMHRQGSFTQPRPRMESEDDFPPPPPELDNTDNNYSFPPPPNWEVIGDLPPPPPAESLGDIDDSFRGLPPPPILPDGLLQGITDEAKHRSILDCSERMYEELVEADTPLLYKALYNYEATQSDDISISEGELVFVLVARDDGWCQGISLKGRVGFFPASYVEREGTVHPNIEQPRLVWLYSSGEPFGMSIDGDCPSRVVSVTPRSAAEKAGIRTGDAILEINDERVADKKVKEVKSICQESAKQQHNAARLVVINVEDPPKGFLRQHTSVIV